jgi:hypothetical protein
MRCSRDAESNRNGARMRNRSLQITEPLRPATILLLEQARQGSNPDQRGWSSPCFRLHHGPLRAFARSLRQESNPPRPYKGRVLAVDTTEAKWRRQGSNLLFLGASEVLCPLSYVPGMPRCGRVESNHHSAAAAALQAAELTLAQRPHLE